MRSINYWLVFVFLGILQIALSVLFRLPILMTVSIFPMLILYMPGNIGREKSLVLTFGISLAVDFFSDGMLGLSAIALLPIALLRLDILKLVSGEEIFINKRDIPAIHQKGLTMFTSIALATALYFLVFVWVDAAGMRPFGFNVLRWLVSTVVSSLVSYLCATYVFSYKA